MKITLPCAQCQIETRHPSFSLFTVDYYDDLVANIKCEKGHNSSQIIQGHKFEILLQSAANALIEGYTLEAACVFSAAYERFLEFCIRVICDKKGVDKTKFEETFKQMSRQSERQLGVFLFLYLLEFGESYKIQNNKITKFRNKYIHNGFIPDPKEVKNFAKNIYDEIFKITKLLKKQCDKNITNILLEDNGERFSKIEDDKNKTVTTVTVETAFFSTANNDQTDNFDEALNNLLIYKKAMTLISNNASTQAIVNVQNSNDKARINHKKTGD